MTKILLLILSEIIAIAAIKRLLTRYRRKPEPSYEDLIAQELAIRAALERRLDAIVARNTKARHEVEAKWLQSKHDSVAAATPTTE